MSRYALIKDGVVENVCEWDGNTQTWSPPVGLTAVQTDTAGPGWTYDGSAFTPPAPPTPTNATTGDPGWFWLRLFTPDERDRWNAVLDHCTALPVADRLADPWAKAVIAAARDLDKARTVNLAEPAVIAGVTNVLRHTFVIGALNITVLASDARRDEVLAGKVVG